MGSNMPDVESEGHTQEHKTVMQGRTTSRKGSASLGWIMAVCGLLFQVGAHGLLLASYCSDYGCFRPGCDGPPPNQCLPPLSDTYIVYEGPYYWATPAAHWRRIIYLFVCAFRNVVEPFCAIQAFQLMVTAEEPNGCLRIWLFRFFFSLQAFCDFAAVWFWNYGARCSQMCNAFWLQSSSV
eukprot:5099039-Amphidinium_carterae.1